MPEAEKGELSVLSAKGEALPFQVLSHDSTLHTYQLLTEVKKVPSLGYEVLHVVPGAGRTETDIKVHGLTLENEALRVTVDSKTGCITSLYDKVSKLSQSQLTLAETN